MSIGKLLLHSMEAVPQSIGADALDVSGRLGPVSPAALACKGLFSPIRPSFGMRFESCAGISVTAPCFACGPTSAACRLPPAAAKRPVMARP